jgi:hypothetical protein
MATLAAGFPCHCPKLVGMPARPVSTENPTFFTGLQASRGFELLKTISGSAYIARDLDKL